MLGFFVHRLHQEPGATGLLVGALEGVLVGARVGARDGALVVGVLVGARVGARDGAKVGGLTIPLIHAPLDCPAYADLQQAN